MSALETLTRLSRHITAGGQSHYQALGLEVESMSHGAMKMSLPYSEAIVGNPETGVVHGGAMTALLDTCCGFAAITVLEEFSFCPTIDLRIDYMRPAEPGQAIIAESEVIRVSQQIIFTRGLAHQGDPSQPVAHCSANFIRLEEKVARTMRHEVEAMLAEVEL